MMGGRHIPDRSGSGFDFSAPHLVLISPSDLPEVAVKMGVRLSPVPLFANLVGMIGWEEEMGRAVGLP